jgi:large subunit ribosomal protein L3
MPLGLLGKKLGHTRVYTAARCDLIPVTVVLAGPNRVLQVKTQAGKDGYNAVQLGFDDQKEQRLTKALARPHQETERRPGETHQANSATFSKDVKPGDIVGPDAVCAGRFH